MTANAHEHEVALLPGAAVRIERITKVPTGATPPTAAYRQILASDRLRDRAVYLVQVTAAG